MVPFGGKCVSERKRAGNLKGKRVEKKRGSRIVWISIRWRMMNARKYWITWVELAVISENICRGGIRIICVGCRGLSSDRDPVRVHHSARIRVRSAPWCTRVICICLFLTVASTDTSQTSPQRVRVADTCDRRSGSKCAMQNKHGLLGWNQESIAQICRD